MNPEQKALKCISIAETFIDNKWFGIAYHLLNQAEEFFPTNKAENLLRFLHPHIKCKSGSQPPEESQFHREAGCKEERTTKTLIEDVLQREEPPAKKSRVAPDTLPGLRHENEIFKEGLIEIEEIILPEVCQNPQEAPDTTPEHKHANQDEYQLCTEEDLNDVERTICSQDCYNILNVNRDASDFDISQRYRKVVQHVNRGKDKDPDAAEALRQVIKAYEILGSPEKKIFGEHIDQLPQQSGYNIYNKVRKLLHQTEEIFPDINVEDLLEYVTTQLIKKTGSCPPTGSEMNWGAASRFKRTTEIKFEPFVVPGPSHSAFSRIKSNKGESTKENDKILNPQPEPPPREEPLLKPINGIVQPPFVPPVNRPGRLTNQLHYIHKFIINTVWKHFSAGPFRQPLGAKNLLDYFIIIRHPMDLGTIKKRLENMYYWSAMECIQDFCVMISNCYAYYELEDAVLFAARKLHELFFNGVHQMPKEEKILENSNDHNSQGSTSAKEEVVLDNGILVIRDLEELILNSGSTSALDLYYFDDEESYFGYQYQGRVKTMTIDGVMFLPPEVAQESFTIWNNLRRPRTDATVLGPSIIRAFTSPYRSVQKSTIGNGEILNPQPGPPPREDPILEPINGIVQPPVEPPPNRPGRLTNQLHFIQNHVINKVWDHCFAWLFHEPVDATNLPDYVKIIRHPMDLGTIKKRLENNYYWSAKECIQDFYLMFTNYHVYNKPWHHSVFKAQVVEKSFLREMAQMPEEEVNLPFQQQQPPPSVEYTSLQPLQPPTTK